MESIKLIMFHNALAVLFFPSFIFFFSLKSVVNLLSTYYPLSSLMRVIALENNHL